MKQYIDKSAVIAKIKSLQDSTVDEEGNFYTAKAQAEYNILCMLELFIDTIKVKEVDLEKEIDLLIKSSTWAMAYREDFLRIAKHFFELGLKAKGE